MKELIASLATSKRFTASVAAGLTSILLRVAGKLGLPWLDPVTAAEAANGIVALGVAYAISQAAADHGKEAAKIQAAAAL